MGKGRYTSNGDVNQDADSPYNQPVGIYGWRKRCLYAFILFLMVITVVNLALIVWILRVLNFSVHGMGKLRMTDEGLRMEGEAEFLDWLYVDKIKSQKTKPLFIDSSQDIVMRSRDSSRNVSSEFTIGEEKLEARCKEFDIKDRSGKSQLHVSDRGILVGADEVYLTGSSKVIFNGSVETPNIQSPRAESLNIEALSTSVYMYAKDEVSIQAPAGDISIKSDDQIILQSKDSILFLDSENLYLKNMRVSTALSGNTQNTFVYQLCMCSSGMLFLAPSTGECRATRDVCS